MKGRLATQPTANEVINPVIPKRNACRSVFALTQYTTMPLTMAPKEIFINIDRGVDTQVRQAHSVDRISLTLPALDGTARSGRG